MFGSEILEIAIGLAFVYLACSLVCSVIKEAISRLWNMRAKDLYKKLLDLLKNPALVDELFKHPLIKGVTGRTLLDKVLKRESIPAFIEPKVLAAALSDVINRHAKELNVDLDGTVTKLYDKTEITDSDKKENILRIILDSFMSTTGSLQEQIIRFGKKFETWFDDAMKSMSVWYKRKAKLIVFFIALVLCTAINVDTIMITKTLYQDDAVRQSIVQAAEMFSETQQTHTDTGTESVDPVNEVKEAVKEVKELKERLEKLGLPIGWNYDVSQEEDPRGKPEGAGWLYKILGILLSSLAVSQGAPFWVDVVRRLIGLRKGSVPPKEEEETGKTKEI